MSSFAGRGFKINCIDRLLSSSHVVIVAGDGLGNEYDVTGEIRYNLAVEASRLMLSRPQARHSAPGPARCQEAVHQDGLAALAFGGAAPPARVPLASVIL